MKRRLLLLLSFLVLLSTEQKSYAGQKTITYCKNEKAGYALKFPNAINLETEFTVLRLKNNQRPNTDSDASDALERLYPRVSTVSFALLADLDNLDLQDSPVVLYLTPDKAATDQVSPFVSGVLQGSSVAVFFKRQKQLMLTHKGSSVPMQCEVHTSEEN
jgi:hypothetical protein